LKRLDRDNHGYTFPTAQFEWPFHYYLGLAHYRNNEFVKTRDILQQLPSLWNTQPKIVILQAETVVHLGNPLGAIAILRNVLRADPENLQAAIALGHCQVSAGRWQDAFETFAEILVKDQDNAEALYGQGLVYAGQNRIPEALDVFEGLTLQDADFIEPLEYLIQFDIQNGQVAKAIERCAGQAERSSQNMTLQLMLANLLFDHKQIDAALEQVTKALSIDPKAVEAHTLLGALYEKKGKSNQAKSSYKAALSFDPRHVQATNSLALLYGAEDAYSKAAWHYNAMAAELSPEDAQVLGRLGGISYKQGNLNSAIMALEKSIRLNSGEPLFHYHLGMAHYKQENFKEARYALEKSLVLDANHASADTAWMALKKMDESPNGISVR
jgi:tetratricopeptide (TPR) repeat protein